MILVSSVEHALASAAADVVKLSKFVEGRVLPELVKAQSNAATVEAVTALVSPQAANIERVGFAVLGVTVKAIQDAGSAAAAGGLSVSLDASVVSDIKSIMPAITSQAASAVAAAKAA